MAIYTSFPEPVNITLYVFAGMGLNLIYAILLVSLESRIFPHGVALYRHIIFCCV